MAYHNFRSIYQVTVNYHFLLAIRFKQIKGGISLISSGMILIWGCLGIITPAEAANVLLLTSYHHSHKWTDDITEGVFTTLSRLDPAPRIYTEHMDATRFSGSAYHRQLTQWLGSKYQNIRFDVVIASDDPAAIYLKAERDTLFPGTPVVFCGSNLLRKPDLKGIKEFSGIMEDPDIISTLKLMLSIHPETQRIYVITDSSQLGIYGSKNLDSAVATIKHKVSFVRLENSSMSDLMSRVKQLSEGDIVLYITFRDTEGDLTRERVKKLETIAKWCRVPIYGVWDCYLGHGIVGGKLINGFKQGQVAGQLARQILTGEPMGNKPLVTPSPNHYMFDYKQMRRFSIVSEQLPEKRTIINQPRSIYTEHRTVIIAFLVGVIGLHFIIFALILNILKFRRAEADILKTQRRFNTILETAKEGFVEIDIHGMVRDVNPEMCGLIGIPRQRIIGQFIFNYLTSSSSLQLQHHLRLAHGGARSTFEVTLTQPNQPEIYCLFNMTPIFDEQQNNVGCFAMVSDVTELKMTESALQKNEEILRATFESTEDGLLVVAQDGRITHVNTKFIQMWNIPYDRIKNDKEFNLLKHLGNILECPEELNTKIGPLQHAPSNAVETLKLRNGHIIERLSCPLILDEREAGRVWSFRDITEKKELEVQLLQAQKMEAIGNLAGGIAHDFNNRLQTISGYTQLLLHDKGRSEADIAKLNATERSVRSSCELIDQLLMFSRKIESRLAPMDLNQEVRHIQNILERTIPRMIQIRLNLASDLGIINADAPQIEQVIMNLGINASHAMPAGGTLTISTANVKIDEVFCKQHLGATPGEFVRLRVQDTGIGMTKEIIEHIFEPFFTTKFAGKGTGLGLAMVHGIIKNHNGYITCKSILNQGSCFDLYFPLLHIDPETLTLIPSAELKMVGGTETILLVEDDEDNLNVGSSMLRRFGYNVLTATNYETALTIFTSVKSNIDLTILDLNMPGTGGESILKALIALEPAAKTLIASGFSGLAVKHALAAGASGYIRKPYQMIDLLNKVRDIIDMRPE